VFTKQPIAFYTGIVKPASKTKGKFVRNVKTLQNEEQFLRKDFRQLKLMMNHAI